MKKVQKISEVFGERMQSMRARLGFTLEEFASKIRVSKRSVSNYELGKLPTKKKLKLIAQELQVSPAFLLGLKEHTQLDEGKNATLNEPSVAYLGKNHMEIDCRNYFAQFLEACDGRQDRLGWTLVMLGETFPLDKWLRAKSPSNQERKL